MKSGKNVSGNVLQAVTHGPGSRWPFLALLGFGVATITGMALSFVVDANANALLIDMIRFGFAIVLSLSGALLTWQMIGSKYLALVVFAIALAIGAVRITI